MRQLFVRGLLVAFGVAIAGTAFVEGAGPGNSANGNSKNCTETEAETEAELTGAGTQTAARGFAQSMVITITQSGKSTTNSTLTIGVKGLKLADASTVTFQLNGTTIGTGAVKNGRATLNLSSKKGSTVPPVNQGDTLTVVDPDGKTVDLTGAFGPVKTKTGKC